MLYDIITLPPLTADYVDSVGPLVTLSYAQTLSKILGIKKIFVPWNCGGRKLEVQGGNYKIQLKKDISKFKKRYSLLGVWNKNIVEIDEFDTNFKNTVQNTLNSNRISTKKEKVYVCPVCHKDKLGPSKNNKCISCEAPLELKEENIVICKWSDEDFAFLLNNANIVGKLVKRRWDEFFKQPYKIKVWRKSLGPNLWSNLKDETFNQRYVAAHWLKYLHEYKTSRRLYVVCGSTVEYKWLLPSLLLLNPKQIANTYVYVHGILKISKEFNKEFTTKDPFFKKYFGPSLINLFSNANCDETISISYSSAAIFRKIVKTANYYKKLVNESHFIKYNLTSKKQTLPKNYLTLNTLTERAYFAFENGQNKDGFKYLTQFFYELNKVLPNNNHFVFDIVSIQSLKESVQKCIKLLL